MRALCVILAVAAALPACTPPLCDVHERLHRCTHEQHYLQQAHALDTDLFIGTKGLRQFVNASTAARVLAVSPRRVHLWERTPSGRAPVVEAAAAYALHKGVCAAVHTGLSRIALIEATLGGVPGLGLCIAGVAFMLLLVSAVVWLLSAGRTKQA